MLLCKNSDGGAAAAEDLVSAGHARMVTTAPAEPAGAVAPTGHGKCLGVV